jgi:hypothetical protein
MSLKFLNVCVILDNSIFSAEADFGLTRLSKAKYLLPHILGSLSGGSISSKYTIIVSKNGLPHTLTIGSRSIEDVVSYVQNLQPEHGKFPMIDCISLASNICLSNAFTQNHIIAICSSPLFCESALSWTSVIDRLTIINAYMSIVSLCGEVYILKTVTEKAGGTYLCYSDDDRITVPAKIRESSSVTLLHSGIVHSNLIDIDPTISHDELQKLCPKCSWPQTNLPQECLCCGLLVTLDVNDILSKPEVELGFKDLPKYLDGVCFCCRDKTELRHSCTRCNIYACISCYENLERIWHVCPNCNHN